MTYILHGIDLYLIGYADDALNLSRCQHGLEDNFINRNKSMPVLDSSLMPQNPKYCCLI